MTVPSVWGVECFDEFEEIYRVNPTTSWELRSEPWSDEHPGMTVAVQPHCLFRLLRRIHDLRAGQSSENPHGGEGSVRIAAKFNSKFTGTLRNVGPSGTGIESARPGNGRRA